MFYLCFFFSQKCQNTNSRKCFDGDSEISWRYDIFSNIIYVYIKKSVMLDKLDMTLLLNNKFLNNRL